MCRGGLEEEFLECCRDSFLEQCVLEPTRERAILDLVLCNEAGRIRDLAVKDPLGESDHCMVEFLVQMEEEKVGSRTRVLCLNRGEYDRMREELANVDWGSALEGESAEEQWRIFKEIFLGAQRYFILMVKKDS